MHISQQNRLAEAQPLQATLGFPGIPLTGEGAHLHTVKTPSAGGNSPNPDRIPGGSLHPRQ
jgi:hypothetical protein